jgi:hypothetical protein
MTWKRDALMVGAGAALAWLLTPKQAAGREPGPQAWEPVAGEKGVVLEPDFVEEEEEDIYDVEADDGYWVRIDGRTVGKVRRTDFTPDSFWWAGFWTEDGEWVDGPEDFRTKEEAADWLRFL